MPRISDLKKIFQNSSTVRHNSEYVTLQEKGKRAGLPKRVRSPRVLTGIHTCAGGGGGGGWRTQHAHRNCSFFSVPLFFKRKFVKSRWFFCALCAMQLCAWHSSAYIYISVSCYTTSVSWSLGKIWRCANMHCRFKRKKARKGLTLEEKIALSGHRPRGSTDDYQVYVCVCVFVSSCSL